MRAMTSHFVLSVPPDRAHLQDVDPHDFFNTAPELCHVRTDVSHPPYLEIRHNGPHCLLQELITTLCLRRSLFSPRCVRRDMVAAAVADADSSVRATARRAYWVLSLRFPDLAQSVMGSLAPSMQARVAHVFYWFPPPFLSSFFRFEKLVGKEEQWQYPCPIHRPIHVRRAGCGCGVLLLMSSDAWRYNRLAQNISTFPSSRENRVYTCSLSRAIDQPFVFAEACSPRRPRVRCGSVCSCSRCRRRGPAGDSPTHHFERALVVHEVLICTHVGIYSAKGCCRAKVGCFVFFGTSSKNDQSCNKSK